jgi:hypothetical protein
MRSRTSRIIYLQIPSSLRKQDLAMRAAEAQFDLLRVQRAKVDLVNGAAKHLERLDDSLPQAERAALAFMRKSKTLAAFDRYERRATSSRNRLLRKLRALQDLRRRQESVELVGPPRPREPFRVVPFVENVLGLEIHRVVKAAIETGVKSRYAIRAGRNLPDKEFRYQLASRSALSIDWRWGPPEKPDACIGVAVDLRDDHHGLVVLIFDVNRQPVVQSCSIARVPTRVGRGKWLVQCPESGKMMQDLYLDVDQQRFRSRHALKLKYRSKAMPAWNRHWERCQKLMDRIGATNERDLPPRPKYMRRATYQWLCDEIRSETLSMYHALLRAHLGESRFEQMRTQALTRLLPHLLDESE